MFPGFPSKRSGPKSQETSHSLSEAGLRRTIAGYNQWCCSRDLLKYMLALLSSTEKCQYIKETHNSYSSKVLVILSAENHQLICLLASLTIASNNYFPLKKTKQMDGIKRSTKKFTTLQLKTMAQCGLKQKSSFFPMPSFFILISVPRIGDAIIPETVKQSGPRVIILHILLNAISQPSKLISSFFQCKPKGYVSHSSFPKPHLVLKFA